jgi:hypothetical protein
MTHAQMDEIRRIQARIDAERERMDGGGNDPHPIAFNSNIISNAYSPIAQQN